MKNTLAKIKTMLDSMMSRGGLSCGGGSESPVALCISATRKRGASSLYEELSENWARKTNPSTAISTVSDNSLILNATEFKLWSIRLFVQS